MASAAGRSKVSGSAGLDVAATSRFSLIGVAAVSVPPACPIFFALMGLGEGGKTFGENLVPAVGGVLKAKGGRWT